MPQTKKRFFKKPKEKESMAASSKVQKITSPKPIKQPEKPKVVQVVQPQKQSHSVINREIFGKSRVLLGNMNWKWGMVGILIVLGLVWNFLALSMFISSLHSWLLLLQQRKKLTEEMNTWENIAKQYPNYRDAYLEGAIYAYRLGDRGKEQYFISQLQLLDPNFPLTKTLEKLTNLEDLTK